MTFNVTQSGTQVKRLFVRSHGFIRAQALPGMKAFFPKQEFGRSSSARTLKITRSLMRGQMKALLFLFSYSSCSSAEEMTIYAKFVLCNPLTSNAEEIERKEQGIT